MGHPSIKPLSKSLLEQMYGFSRETRRKLMNDVFFEELSAAGYKKKDRIISPKVQERFIEVYGAPVDHFKSSI